MTARLTAVAAIDGGSRGNPGDQQRGKEPQKKQIHRAAGEDAPAGILKTACP